MLLIEFDFIWFEFKQKDNEDAEIHKSSNSKDKFMLYIGACFMSVFAPKVMQLVKFKCKMAAFFFIIPFVFGWWFLWSMILC